MSTTTVGVNYKYILGIVDSLCYERLFMAINGNATYSILSAMQSKSWFWCSASVKVWVSCFHLPRAGSLPILSTSTRRPMIFMHHKLNIGWTNISSMHFITCLAGLPKWNCITITFFATIFPTFSGFSSFSLHSPFKVLQSIFNYVLVAWNLVATPNYEFEKYINKIWPEIRFT